MENLSPPLQRRSKETLDAISNATKELLRTRSFTELTIQDIVNEAGSSAGSFYARFKGKRALLHYLHEELAESWLKQIRDAVAASELEDVSPAELAKMLVPEIVNSHTENRGILRATLVESLDDPLFVGRAGNLVHSISEALAERTARTARRKDRHVANLAQAIATVVAVLDQNLFYDKSSTRRVPKVEVARLQRIFVASLSSNGD